MFDLGVDTHMYTCSPNVKSSILIDAYLPINVDKESEMTTLSLSAFVDSKETLLEIFDCKDDCFFGHKAHDCFVDANVLCKSKWFGDFQA